MPGARRPTIFVRSSVGARAMSARVTASRCAKKSSTWDGQHSAQESLLHDWGNRGNAGMAKLRIEGGRRLSGRITVEGNKNSALPLLAACLLTDQECVLSNVPRIRDVDVLAEIMVGLGATVEGRGTSVLRVTCKRVTSDCP